VASTSPASGAVPSSQLGCAQKLSFGVNKGDSIYPRSALFQASDGTMYGTAYEGGSDRQGTVFSEGEGFGPFVAFVRNPAKVGQRFGLLGQGLKQTSSVSLNGTAAKFTVKSDPLIEATVPAGAGTGFVTVTTPSGILTSNVPFHVIP